MHRIGILFAFFLVSCSSVRFQDFHVNAIDTEKKDIPCFILEEDHAILDKKTNEPILTPATIRLEFKTTSDGTGYENIKLGVKAAKVDSDGKVDRVYREEDESPYLDDFRMIFYNDAKRQLFIILKKK